jgi:hypothetical protein
VRNLTVAVMTLAVLCGGCSLWQQKYDHQELDLRVSSTLSIEVGVVDVRPYVLDDDQSPEFVGFVRGTAGIPINVHTESGEPLATDMSNDIVASLQAAGVKARQMNVTPTLGPVGIRQKLIASDADRALLITLLEWKSDTQYSVWLQYDVRLDVFNREGQTLATSQRSGNGKLLGGWLNLDAGSSWRKAPPVAFKAIMEGLFRAPAVAAALK